MQGQFWKNFPGAPSRPRGAGPARGGARPPHGPYAGRIGARNVTLPAQPDFLCVASPIIGSDCEPSLICASELCRFTTMNQECSTTHAFSCNRRAFYLRFCKRRTHGARGVADSS